MAQLVRFISKDKIGGIDYNIPVFLEYLALYKEYCQAEERSDKIYNEYFESSIFPKIVTQVLWYDLIVTDKLPKSNFPYFDLDFGQKKLLGISKKELKSKDYWKVWGEQHELVIKRILEPDFHSYKNNTDLLKQDMKGD